MTYKLRARNALVGEQYTWHVHRCRKSISANNAKSPAPVFQNRCVNGMNRADKIVGKPLETIENTNRGGLLCEFCTHVMYMTLVSTEQSCHVLAAPLALSHNLTHETYFPMYFSINTELPTRCDI